MVGELTVEKMLLDDEGKPQPTGEFETLKADSLVLALGQDVDLSLLDGVPGLSIHDGVVQVDTQMMTGCPGVFAGAASPVHEDDTMTHGRVTLPQLRQDGRRLRVRDHVDATHERREPQQRNDAEATATVTTCCA